MIIRSIQLAVYLSVYMVKLISLVGVYASMTQDMLKYHLAGVKIYSMCLCSKGTECATSNAQSLAKMDKCGVNCAGNNFTWYHSYFHCDQNVL